MRSRCAMFLTMGMKRPSSYMFGFASVPSPLAGSHSRGRPAIGDPIVGSAVWRLTFQDNMEERGGAAAGGAIPHKGCDAPSCSQAPLGEAEGAIPPR